jgi:hypothetical protein
MLLLVTSCLLLVTSCTVDAGDTVRTDCPSRTEFEAVSPVLEERCGTLDCHGQLSRPLRVYSALGMRLGTDPGAFSPGTGVYPDAFPTTEDERDATRRSLCALEPEVMAAVRAGDRGPNELTVVRKADGSEKHKGGVVFHDGDGGERCLVGWIEGTTDSELCASALDAAP